MVVSRLACLVGSRCHNLQIHAHLHARTHTHAHTYLNGYVNRKCMRDHVRMLEPAQITSQTKLLTTTHPRAQHTDTFPLPYPTSCRHFCMRARTNTLAHSSSLLHKHTRARVHSRATHTRARIHTLLRARAHRKREGERERERERE
jgi:hypothetical protein